MPRDFLTLMDAFTFSEASVEANRTGRLTEGQLDMLKQKATLQVLFGAVGAAIGIVLMIFVFTPSENFLLFALLLFLWIWAMYAVYAQYRRLQTDIQSGTASMVSGKAALHIARSGRGSRSYHLAVSGKVFRINRAKYQVLDRYLRTNNIRVLTVYFTPTANVLLSIEG